MRGPVTATLAAAAALSFLLAAPAAHATTEPDNSLIGTLPAVAVAPAVTAHPGGRAWPAFFARVHHVSRRELGKSWRPGCPVGPSGLRQLTVRYADFGHRARTGRLVVAAAAVKPLIAVMHSLYHHRFPIRRMRPVAVYGGNDNRSMRHDNTSAFNCRYAVANGPKTWSEHAYGEAIDLNTVENPYVLNGRVRPAAGKPYADRSRHRPGMITPDSLPVRAFEAVGWGWGGNWSSPDWQHFSVNGR